MASRISASGRAACVVAARKLTVLDRYLTLWIFLAMAVGVGGAKRHVVEP